MRFCGDGDDHLIETAPRACARHVREAGASGVLKLFASGGLDVRARALVEQIVECDDMWNFISNLTQRTSYQACATRSTAIS